MKKIKSFFLCLVAITTMSLTSVQITYAANLQSMDCAGTRNFLSFPTWDRGLKCEENKDAPDPTSTRHVKVDDIPTFVWTVVLNILDILLRLAGILAVVMLIMNGYQYLTSAGVPDKISKAKTGLLHAIVGLAIALMASTIIYFIVGEVV
jgi:hypothetical protein